MMNMTMNATRVITGPAVFSYLTVNEPKVPLGGGRPKYSVSLIIPKSDTVTVDRIQSAIRAAYAEGQAKLMKDFGSVPPLEELKTPLRDGDLERSDNEVYQNSYFLNASSVSQPGVVDANRQPITDTSELYSGIIGRASINFYAYNVKGNRGIACGLNNLQKLADGKPLGHHTRAEDDFAEVEQDKGTVLSSCSPL